MDHNRFLYLADTEVVEEYLQSNSSPHAIITKRFQELDRLHTPFCIEEMKTKFGSTVFLVYDTLTKRITITKKISLPPKTDEPKAARRKAPMERKRR